MPFLPILSGLWSFATSQIGIVMIVGIFAFGYGSHRANVACAQKEAAAKVEYMKALAAEDERQRKANEAIQSVDSVRMKEAVAAGDAMQAEIDALKSELEKAHEKDRCASDRNLGRRVQRLDRAARSKR